MDNTEKLLRAFIDASGYDIEEVKSQHLLYKLDDLDCNQDPYTDAIPHFIYNVDYKVTKKTRGGIKCIKCGTRLYHDAPLDSCLCKKPDDLVRYY